MTSSSEGFARPASKASSASRIRRAAAPSGDFTSAASAFRRRAARDCAVRKAATTLASCRLPTAVTRYALLQACYGPCNSLKSLKTKGVYIYFYLVLQRKIYMYTRTHTHTHTYTPA